LEAEHQCAFKATSNTCALRGRKRRTPTCPSQKKRRKKGKKKEKNLGSREAHPHFCISLAAVGGKLASLKKKNIKKISADVGGIILVRGRKKIGKKGLIH
jgi:hypothetical protein